MPIGFWGECIQAATFLINRLPTPVLNMVSPYELLFHKPPNYHELRVFGCLCYAATLRSQRSKFCPRSIPSIFVGYLLGFKGYRLYDLKSRQFFISRDVEFHEGVFPFHHLSECQTDIDPFPDLVLPTPQPLPDQSLPLAQVNPPVADNAPSSAAPSVSTASTPAEPLRRSSRITRPPSYLRDYDCHNVFYPICNHVSYHRLSDSYKTYVLQVSNEYEPQFFHQAVKFP